MTLRDQLLQQILPPNFDIRIMRPEDNEILDFLFRKSFIFLVHFRKS